ncbi:putative ribonuclease H-like domain-containing protein [Tanacetum coccineum]
MSLIAVLLKTGLTALNNVRPVNIAHPKIAVHNAKSMTHFSKQAQSTAKRPFYKQTTLTKRSVHAAKRHYYTGALMHVNYARPTNLNGAYLAFKRHNYIDARGRYPSYGCSRHMTGNIAYHSDFKEFDGGYVAFRGGIISNDSAGTSEEISQDCIEVEDGPNNENVEQDKFGDDSSTKDVNAAGKHVNTASLDVNTEVSHTLEATHIEFFSDEDEPEVDLGNITNSYTVGMFSDMYFKEKKQQAAIRKRNSRMKRGSFKDLDHPDKVYKVVKALYGLHQAPRAWYETLANYLLGNGFKRVKIDQTLFIKKQKGDILLVQVYVDGHLFGSINKQEYVSGFIEKIMKDKSMIGSLMYLTTSRPDIMFAVCACARFQVTPKTSHLLAVKRIFRYLKGKPTLGLWLISWQCKKQTVVATSTTEAEYVAAASCCGQVLWIQNQLLDYGYNFMNTVINIDNNNLLTKGFDAGRFQYLVSSIGMLNP